MKFTTDKLTFVIFGIESFYNRIGSRTRWSTERWWCCTTRACWSPRGWPRVSGPWTARSGTVSADTSSPRTRACHSPSPLSLTDACYSWTLSVKTWQVSSSPTPPSRYIYWSSWYLYHRNLAFKKKWMVLVLFVGPLIPLIPLLVMFAVGLKAFPSWRALSSVCNRYLRFTSGSTPSDLVAARRLSVIHNIVTLKKIFNAPWDFPLPPKPLQKQKKTLRDWA